MRPALGVGPMLLMAAAAVSDAADSVGDLKHQYELLEAEIAETRAEADKHEGGLLASLIAARLEILRTSAALVQQRIHLTEADAEVSVVAPVYARDPVRGAELERDIEILERRIASQEVVRAVHTGGLAKAMVDSGIATTRLSLEMLRLERLKAKYGLAWMPEFEDDDRFGVPPEQPIAAPEPQIANPELPVGAAAPPIGAAPPGDKSRGQVAVTASPERKTSGEALLAPVLSNKSFQQSDWRNGSYEDLVLFDVSWDTSRLRQPTRAVKGALVFADLFGEPHFRVRMVIDQPLEPGAKFTQAGQSFAYNQFLDDHKWVRSTDLGNMNISFETQEVMYADGSRERF